MRTPEQVARRRAAGLRYDREHRHARALAEAARRRRKKLERYPSWLCPHTFPGGNV